MYPRFRRFRLLLACAIILSAIGTLSGASPPTVTASTAYTITDLGTLRPDNSGRSNATSINANGQITGSAVYGADLVGHAFRREPGGTMRDLGTLHPADLGGSSANALNASGTIVGTSNLPDGLDQATVWQIGPGGNTSKRGLGDLTTNGSGRSSASDINDQGVIVGTGTGTINPELPFFSHAIRWRIAPDGGIDKLDLGTLVPYGMGTSFAHAINNAGVIVGEADSFHGYTAVRWQIDPDSGSVSAIDLEVASPDVGGTVAYDINDAGLIVGMRAVQDGFDTQGTLWRVAEDGSVTYQHLPALLEQRRGISTAVAINSGGIIVGKSSIVPQPAYNLNDHHAVRWQVNLDNSVAVTDLNGLIPLNSGWELYLATGINDAGQIVGVGHRNGEDRAFILNPIEGNTLAITTRNSVTGRLDAREFGSVGTSSAPAPGPYAPGTTVTLTAQPKPNAIFTGWVVDGVPRGWNSQLQLVIQGDHAIQANFGPRPNFTDVLPNNPALAAIEQLAARGVVQGYGFFGCQPPRSYPCFGPNDELQRAQVAVMLVRALGWQDEPQDGAPFSDLGTTDDEMRRAIRILAAKDVVAGYGDGRFGPGDDVLHIQVVSIIARAMVNGGYWVPVTTNDRTIYPNIPADSPHRLDLLTYVARAGALPDRPQGADWPDWLAPGSRAWTAQVLWQALNSTFGP